MLEGAVMEYVKWYIAIISVMFIMMAVIFMFKMNEVNVFQQEVNYQIERHGGLTLEAKKKLNQHTKDVYGGCLAESHESNAPCLFREDDGMTSSGFFVREYQTIENGNTKTTHYYDRGDDEQARYGTPVDYVISRQIGQLGTYIPVNPMIVGTSASRVRGSAGQ